MRIGPENVYAPSVHKPPVTRLDVQRNRVSLTVEAGCAGETGFRLQLKLDVQAKLTIEAGCVGETGFRLQLTPDSWLGMTPGWA